MAIEIVDSSVEEPLNYKNVFMTNLTVDHQLIVHDDDLPLYKISLTYRIYAIDSEKVIHYKKQSHMVFVEDFIAEAMAQAAAGDMDLIASFQAIEITVGKIIAQQRNLDIGIV